MKPYIVVLSLLLSCMWGCQPFLDNTFPHSTNATQTFEKKKPETFPETGQNDENAEQKSAQPADVPEPPKSGNVHVQAERKADLTADAPETAQTINRVAENFSEIFASEMLPLKTKTVGGMGEGYPLKTALSLCEKSQTLWEKGDIESALGALDQAYALILNADTDSDPDMARQKEDLRLLISKRILEIYASRNVVAKGNHQAIPLVMNDHVRDEIRFLTSSKNGEESFFVRAYRRSGKYRPYIVEELKKAGLPVELSWLPLIESGFKVYALSTARALGLWQFIQSTGAKFGLERNRYVDERLDPYKATKAAIAYLKELHSIFGDWTTVLAAYNCGEGRVLRVIREQNVNYLDNFWDLYKQLPRETAQYVPRFLAAIHIAANPEKYGIDLVRPDLPPEYETVTVSRQLRLKDIANSLGTDKKMLKDLNPELRHNMIPPGCDYALRVPPEHGDILLSKLDQIAESSFKVVEKKKKKTAPPIVSARTRKATATKKASKPFYHKIRRGETIASIARKYRTSVTKIRKANRLGKRARIIAGRTLRIPGKRSILLSYASKAKKTRASRHLVRKGDSLWNIARRYGTTPKTIRKLNGLSRSAKLHVGQKLMVKGTASLSKKKRKRVYRVRRGDAPHDIAKRYNMDLGRFLRVNHLKRGSKIFPGQKLYIVD